MRLVVGLGNVGGAGTPHNFGRAVCARMCGEEGEGGAWRWGWWWGCMAWVRVQGEVCYMMPGVVNTSGWSVRRVSQQLRVESRDVLVVADDLRLRFGEVRCADRIGGSAHNGLKSIAAHLSTDAVKLVRVGADRGRDLKPYRGVLTSLRESEDVTFATKILPEAVKAVQRFAAGAWQ